MTGKKYRYKNTVLFVREYKAVNSMAWGPFFVDRQGRDRAYTTAGLTLGHMSEAEAQAELDAFAAAHELKAVRQK